MMKKILIFFIAAFTPFFANAQNVGIGTSTPRFPLSLGAVSGAKISLYDDGNPAQVQLSVISPAYIFLLINTVKELQQEKIKQQKQIDQILKSVNK